MGRKKQGPYQKKSGGIYYCRLVVPTSLRDAAGRRRQLLCALLPLLYRPVWPGGSGFDTPDAITDKHPCFFTNVNPSDHAQWVVIESRLPRAGGATVVRRMLRHNSVEAWETMQTRVVGNAVSPSRKAAKGINERNLE